MSTVFVRSMWSCMIMTIISSNNVMHPRARVVARVSWNNHDTVVDPVSDSVIVVIVSVIYGCKYKRRL